MSHKTILGAAALGSLLASAPVHAQIINAPANSLRGQIRDALTPLGSAQTASTLVALSSLEVATAPLGTSTGGFTFSFDPILRMNRLEADSFGPSFGQRSLTTGKGKFSIGANYLHASYDSLGGFDLEDGSFRIATNIAAPALPFSATQARVRLATDTIVGFGQVGITDRIDVGVVVPWVRVSLGLDGAYLDGGGQPIASAPRVAISDTSASGFGDMAVYAKWRALPREDGGLAASVEMRLPTGDKNQLRGLEVTRTMLSAIWSKKGRVSPHASAGFEVWSSGVPITSDGSVSAQHQWKYAAGLELNASPQVTVLVDLVGSRILGGGQLGYQRFTVPGGTGDLLVGLPEGISSISLAPGLKWNVWRNVLVTANLLANLKNDGLRARWTPVVGFDFAF